MKTTEILSIGNRTIKTNPSQFKNYYENHLAYFNNEEESDNLIEFEIQYLKYLMDVEGNYQEVILQANKLKTIPNISLFSLSKIYRNNGTAYYHLGEYKKSMEAFIESINLLNKINQRNFEQNYELGLAYFNTSLFFREQIDDKYNNSKRLEFLRMAEKIFIEINSTKGLGIFYSGLANYYSSINKYGLALRYQFKSIEYKKKENDQIGLAINYGNLSTIYLEYNKLEKAEYYILLSKELKENEASNYSKCILYEQLGKLYMAKKDFSKAIDYLEIALNIAEKHSLIKEEETILTKIAIVYENMNDFVNAYKIINRKINVQKQLFDINKNNELLELKYKYENEIKEAEINIKKQEYELMYAQILRNQMNPHFIYNTLNSISTLIKQGNNNLADTYLYKFSILTRKIFNYNLKPTIKLIDEISLCEDYLILENLRFKNLIEYKIDSNKTLNDFLIPPMIIQPIIENAIKHGLFHIMKERKAFINVNIKLLLIEEVKYLQIQIIDNGIGTNKTYTELFENDARLGSLKVLEKRLNLLNKNIADYKIGFISKLEIGTEVHLLIQLNS